MRVENVSQIDEFARTHVHTHIEHYIRMDPSSKPNIIYSTNTCWKYEIIGMFFFFLFFCLQILFYLNVTIPVKNTTFSFSVITHTRTH